MAINIADLMFIGAVIDAGRYGDKRQMLELLRANYALTAEDKRYLADLLDGKIKPRRGRPLVREGDARDLDRAIVRVKYIKRLMRQRGQRYRIHGTAIKLARKWLERDGFPVPTEAKIVNRLRRSSRKSRGNSK